MHIHHLLENNSVLSTFISELRDVNIQKDSLRFRRNIERVGEILSYELSKQLNYTHQEIQTPLGSKQVNALKDKLVVCSILRAGLPLHQGILNYFDKAENSFISAYRHHLNQTDFEIRVEYMASPAIDKKTLIIADPMLATGRSFVNVYNAIKQMGNPKEIHLVAVIGAKAGVELLQKEFPKNTHLWIATIDEKLNDQGYIVPGLGDAGDLCYGEKMQH